MEDQIHRPKPVIESFSTSLVEIPWKYRNVLSWLSVWEDRMYPSRFYSSKLRKKEVLEFKIEDTITNCDQEVVTFFIHLPPTNSSRN